LKEEIIRKLLDGIRRHGIDNISVLSKHTGIPVETARYMIWEELPRYFIVPRISINLLSLGLNRFRLEIQPSKRGTADALEQWLKRGTGLMVCSRTVPDDSVFCILGIPIGKEGELETQLNRMKEEGVIQNYSLQKIEWIRHLSFNARFYDFKKRDWSFDWNDLNRFKESPITPRVRTRNNFTMDYKDLQILRGLRERVPRTLSQLSKTLKLGQHNLRYHYRNHASKAIQGTYLQMISKHSNSIIPLKFVFQPVGERSLYNARETAISIPFTTSVWKTETEYGWFVNCPGEHLNGLLHFLNERFVRIPGKLRVLLSDAKREVDGSIPTELYNEKTESWVYEPKLLVGRS
jgi:hypothetical protein